MDVFLSHASYQASLDKIDKINARATKRGFTGRWEIVGVEAQRSQRIAGQVVTEYGYEVTVTGEPPKYNGYTLLASLDWEEAGVVVHTAPGVDKVDRDLIVKGQCVHCKVNRRRVKGYLVGTETGEQLQVGSTCIKDFLGWDGNVVFLSKSDVEDDLGWTVGGSFGTPDYDVLGVLGLAYAVTAELGYVRAGEIGATKDVVDRMLNDKKPRAGDWSRDAQQKRQIEARAAESKDKAVEIRAWILSDDFAGDSEYVQNLKTIAAGDRFGWKSLGLLVSAPQTYLRSLERKVERDARIAAEKDERVNEYVGTVKDRIELWITVKSFRYIESDWGTTTLYLMRDDEGHTFKWFASSMGFHEDVDGRYFVRGTIKGHEEYQGLKSTMLTRVAILNPETRKPFKDAAESGHYHGRHEDEADPTCKFCWINNVRNAA